MTDIMYDERSPLALPSEPTHVKLRKSVCYALLVAACFVTLALIGTTLLFAVRPALLARGLPVCSVASDWSALQPWPANRQRLLATLPAAAKAPDALVFVRGATDSGTTDGGVYLSFAQSVSFRYLTGAELPGCALLMAPNGNTTFFIGDIDAVWTGRTKSLTAWARELLVDQVLPVAQLDAYIAAQTEARQLFTMPNTALPSAWNASVDTTVLPLALQQARLIKTAPELELLAAVSRVSSGAHEALMNAVGPVGFEYTAEARLLEGFLACDCPATGYAPIVAAGYNSAVLHYSANSQPLAAGQLLLVDAAAALKGYTCDLTRTMPVNAAFTKLQADVYNAVLLAQSAAQAACRAGVPWAALSTAARSSLALSLYHMGFLSVVPADPRSVVALFMPHGLSHSVGLEVHDTPDVLPPTLAADMVITIEPGIYFNEAVLTDAAFAANPSVVKDKVMPLVTSGFGGVRIEDVYHVTAAGCVALTTAPKTVAAVEAAMAK